MKTPLLIGILLSYIFTSVATYAEYKDKFSVPPYSLNSSAVNVNGWTLFGTGSSAETTALIVAKPWDTSKSALRLQKTSSADSIIRLKNSSFTPISGLLNISVSMAFDFNPITNSGRQTYVTFDDPASTASAITFGVDYKTGGGLYYNGVSGQVFVLGKENIKMNSPFVFSLDVNTVTKTYDIKITGTKTDNTIFFYSQENAGFFNNRNLAAINAIYLNGNTANQLFVTYIDSISIAAIPEPSTVALVAGGVVGLYFLKKVKPASVNSK